MKRREKSHCGLWLQTHAAFLHLDKQYPAHPPEATAVYRLFFKKIGMAAHFKRAKSIFCQLFHRHRIDMAIEYFQRLARTQHPACKKQRCRWHPATQRRKRRTPRSLSGRSIAPEKTPFSFASVMPWRSNSSLRIGKLYATPAKDAIDLRGMCSKRRTAASHGNAPGALTSVQRHNPRNKYPPTGLPHLPTARQAPH